MQLITEKNISKIIIYVFIIIMTTMILMISYFYVKKTYEDFDRQMDKYVQDYYKNQKIMLKKEIDTIIDVIKYNATKSDEENEEELKMDTVRLLNNISFDEDKSNYIFVYEILDINGGDDFAKLLVNPNRPDLLGVMISTNYKDANGKKFRQEFMEDIRIKGESYTEYSYKKVNSDISNQKLSYFKYFPRWRWVIAVGVYTDDIEEEISRNREQLQQSIQNQIVQNILLFTLFLSIAIVISILVSQKIDEVLKSYQRRVKAKTDELNELNENLEKRVEGEIEKNREHEQLLVQKSKFIALGEMISNIAHQWRQPLSELSSIFMNIKFKYYMERLDEKVMDKKVREAEAVLEFMSHTIDDFRNFFMPKKSKEEFYLRVSMDSIMTIISSALSNNSILVDIDVPDNIKLNTYANEFQQVILNIITNAKDVLIQNKIEEPWIKIYAKETENNVILLIEDNGGGIKVEPKSKVFEPYFTTKKDSDGTGIGLYMSKIIVEKNMNGKLKVRDTKHGARFEIYLPK
ncbi:ATP-binding protein [Arcobacter sp. CECT 8983]|uniref:cache domain-containing protein n=1 Tax=Arcobacter sp. CECT 8983 TaxID=2044508 RepID=UPI00100A9864|nr:cache domain-containing protein [Arcobacter sp. CECT 8983]RXJ90533.1 ATP-binding protein [Arcobacter sp. CECT 8983]